MSIDVTYEPALSRVLIRGGGLESNGGFETGIAEWNVIGGTPTQSADFAHTGEQSLKMTPDGVSAVPIAQTTSDDSPAAVAGTEYRLNGWYYSPAGWSGVSLAITWRDGADAVITTAATATVAIAAGVWTEFELIATAPTNTAEAQLRARMHNTPAVTDVLYVDDMVLVPSAAVTADIDKSLTQVVWEPVRGGIDYDLANPIELSDYEFANATDTFYRITLRDAAGVSLGQSPVVSIAPEITRVWLKSIIRPFLNQAVFTTNNLSGWGREARNGAHYPVGRSLPIGITDVRHGKTGSIEVHCETTEERNALDALLSYGDIIFVHCPADFPSPSFYAMIGSTNETRPGFPSSYFFDLPLVACDAPGPDIVGSTTSWNEVVASYATWNDVVADKASWNDLLRRITDPQTVVVP